MFCYIFVLINIYNSNIKTVSNIVNKNTVMRGDFNFHFDSNLKLKGQKQPPEVFFKKKVFLEISQNSKENTCARVSFLIKLQALQLYFQKRLWHRCFCCKFSEISKNNFFLQSTSRGCF